MVTLQVVVDADDRRTSLSYLRLSENYAFAGVAQSDLGCGGRFSDGRTMVAVPSSLTEFIEQFQFFTRVDLLAICDQHSILVSTRLPLQGLRDLLRVHTCTTHCCSAPFLFRQLRRRRRTSLHVQKAPAVLVDKYVEKGRERSRRGMKQIREHRRAEKGHGHLEDVVENEHVFPPHRSKRCVLFAGRCDSIANCRTFTQPKTC